jgi:hypothetical protein
MRWVPLLWLVALTAHAQEIVTLDTRPGVTQPFFIAGMGGVEAKAVALLFIGGGGYIRLRMEDGQPRFGAQNFLPRARAEFIRNGILPVVMENPSDQQGHQGMNDAFRASTQHAGDVRAVVAEVKRRHPGLPVFLVTTSRSTISGAHLARALGDEVAGVVLSSSLFYVGQRSALAGFDFATIKRPLLLVHHREDACPSTPYTDADRLSAVFPLVSVKGGKPPQSGPCDPFAPHGFFGKEAETVDAIAAWMLQRPYRKDID